ncbi:MAG: proline--tRNA ligase [Candidatus Saelkia tenebricola]|nr:proline--tRNA ligase [Candidatus Saelkia tenebricola]
MRFTKMLIPTLKEIPKEAEALSHRLMLRSGMIRRLASGLYCYLPLGWRVMLKVMTIIREEMNAEGAQEVLLPAIHPQELWEKTGRFAVLGDDMIKFKNRSDKSMVLGPTHEEIITWLLTQDVKSYKQLPQVLYQIQTKFRDEPRPRFGVVRTCEFIMKDAYSFNESWESLDESYKKMYHAYCRIFERCGVDFLAVEADPGIMGGDVSHEFMAISEFGEDKVVVCEKCNYLASKDVAQRAEDSNQIDEKEQDVKEVYTPEITSVSEVSKFFKISPQKLLKTIIYKADSEFIAVILRGGNEVNENKLRKYLGVKELRMSSPEEIKHVTSSGVGFSGPVGLKIKIFADYDVKGIKNCVTGANRTDYHLINVNEGRDFKVEDFADLRQVEEGDLCFKCKSELKISNAIEIGHVFKLGTRYSDPLGAVFVDDNGKERNMIMGCYGIGVNRIIAAYIEQNYDQKGIIWSKGIAPFEVVVIATNIEDETIAKKAEQVYKYLLQEGIEVLYDDRLLRAGAKFNDADLIGISYQVVIGTKYLKEKKMEFRSRNKEILVDLNKEEQLLQYLK